MQLCLHRKAQRMGAVCQAGGGQQGQRAKQRRPSEQNLLHEFRLLSFKKDSRYR